MCLLIGFLILLLYVSYRLYRYYFPTPDINTNGKYVLISGCDSGFGNLLAIELDRKGFNVLAGVLLQDNVKSLQQKLSPKATVFRLDITKQEDIDTAFDLVKTKTNILHGLVNNAGIALGEYIDWMPMENLRKVMEVNFFGHVAMTKKFLPLLIAKRDSRVVNICSVAGFIGIVNLGAYCSSKYALEAFSDCLRREMGPWGLRVSIIEPGYMRTPILRGSGKSVTDLWNSISSDAQERWGQNFFECGMDAAMRSLLRKYAEDPMKVVRALQHAVMNTQPCIRYRPGWQSSMFFFPLSTLPACFVDWFFAKLGTSKSVPAGVDKQQKD